MLDKTQSERLEYVRLDCVASIRSLGDDYEGHGFRFVRVEKHGEVDLSLYQLFCFRQVSSEDGDFAIR